MATVDTFRRQKLAPLAAVLLGCLVLLVEGSDSPVPVFIWTGDKSGSLAQQRVTLGQTLKSEDVQSTYLQPLLTQSHQNLVLFLQDELSIDDIAKYSAQRSPSQDGVFSYLRKALSTSPSVTIPSVKYASDSPSMTKYLQQSVKGTQEEIFSSDIDEWEFTPAKLSKDSSANNLFVFHLPSVQGSNEEAKVTILSINDMIISRVMQAINSHSSLYTAILTASSPSKFVQTHVANDAVEDDFLETNTRRHLLGVTPMGGGVLFNYSNCVLLYAKAIKLDIGSNATANVIDYATDVTGQCGNHSQTSITINFKDFNASASLTKFKLTLDFELNVTSEWRCSSMTVDYAGKFPNKTETNGTLHRDCSGLVVPRHMSYACGESRFPFGNSSVFLTFDSFQVQPFPTGHDFGAVSDCAPFFTIPILTGIFAAVVLISVIFVGLFAMMHIQATDRFDDPKAPTIQVVHEG